MADVATLVFDIDSGPARTAVTDLIKMNYATARVDRTVAAFNKTLRDENGRFATTASVAKKYGAEIESLAAKYNPALNAVLKYQREQGNLAKAVKLGVLTQAQADAALIKYTNDVQAAAASTNTLAVAQQRVEVSSRSAAYNVRNLGYQLNDITMMSLTGQSLFYLVPQQGLQVVQVLQQMRDEGQKVGPALVGAFRQVVNPMSLVTLAAVAGGAALLQWAFAADEAGNSAEDSASIIGGLSASINSTTSAIQNASQPLSELIEKYGALAQEAQIAFEQQSRISQANLISDIRQAQGAFSAILDGTTDTVRQLQFASQEAERLARNGDDASNAIAIAEVLSRNLSDSIGLSADDAAELLSLVEAWGSAAGPRELSIATGRINDFIADAVESGARLPDELLKAANEAAGVNVQLLEMMALINSLPSVAGVLFGDREGDTQRNMWAGVRPQVRPSDIDFGVPQPERPGRTGGGGQSEADRLREEMSRRYDALIQGFQSETQATMQHYATGLETLQWALEQRRITEEEYNSRRAELQLFNFGTEAQQNEYNYQIELQALQASLDLKYLAEEQYYMRLRELQDSYYSQAVNTNQSIWAQEFSNFAGHFGQMNTLAGGGYDNLLRLQKSFAAASTLINAYQAAVQAMNDPTLPWYAKLAAYGKVLAAGLGAVNAIKGGGKGGGAAAGAATKAEPDRYVYLHLDGDQAMTGMVESIVSQIYEQSKNGRVIIARGQ